MIYDGPNWGSLQSGRYLVGSPYAAPQCKFVHWQYLALLLSRSQPKLVKNSTEGPLQTLKVLLARKIDQDSSAVFTTEQFPPNQYAPSDLYSEWFRREPDLPCMAASSRL